MEKASLYIMRDTDGVKGYFPSSSERAVIGTYTYDAQRMGGAPTITGTLMYSRCLDNDWTKKEYVVYRGEKYYLKQIPSSSKDSADVRYKHELTFVSERQVLENVYFLDVVTSDTEEQYQDRYRSNTSKVHFYGDIEEFVARINDSLIYSGLYDKTTGEGYRIVIDEGISTEAKDVNIEDKFITEALQDIYNIFELAYYWVGKTCHVGYTENAISTPIEYGSDNALLSIQKTNENYRLINRITGTGGTTNLPYYYPNTDAVGSVEYTVSNADEDVVKSVSLNAIMKYNPAPYTSYKLFTVNSGRGNVRNAPFYANGEQTTFDNVSTITVSGGTLSLASRIFKYKIYGLKGCSLTFSSPNSLIGFIKTSGDGDTRYAVKTFVRTWNGTLPPDDSDSVSDVNEMTFESDGWYEFDMVVDVRYENGSTPLVLKMSPMGYINYEYKLSGRYFFYGDDGEEVAYADSGIVLDFGVHIDNSIFDVDFVEGEWVKTETYHTDTPLTVNITGRNWIAPSQNLMPSIYRESGGAERYYNAVNGMYDDGNGSKYSFNNTYDKTDPREGMTTFEEIVPTIEGMQNSKGQLFGQIADIRFDSDDSDALKDRSDNEYLHSYFYVKLHVFDGQGVFNLFEHALESDEAAIEMTSGNCAACRFQIAVDKYANGDAYDFYNPVMTDESGNLRKVNTSNADPYDGDYILPARNKDSYVPRQQDTSRYEVWIAVKKETDTFGIIMPNASQGYRPSVGDTFVITGISLPESYITEAEKRLDAALIAYMKANNDDKFTFSIKFSRVFLAQNEEFAEKLNENARLLVRYDNEDYVLYVSNYSCKADEDILYEVTVDLTDTLTVSQSSLQAQLDSVKTEILESLPGMRGDILAQGVKYFIRKDIPDTAQGLITFLGGLRAAVKSFFDGGLEVGETVDSMLAGKGTLVTKDGRVQTDRLEVRGSMTVMDLVINQIQGMAADYSFSDCGKITAVEDLGEDTYRLTLDKATAYDYTTLGEDDVCFSIVNTLKTGGTDYYTSWMRVVNVNLTDNALTVVLYPDAEVPGGKNYAPAAGYNMTRRGNSDVPDTDAGEVNERAQSWLLSSREGRIMFLQNVFKPILEDWNYGIAIGKLPKTSALEQVPVSEGDLGVMADVVIARHFYEFDGNGRLITKKNDRGQWSLAVAQSDAPYRYMTHEWQNPSTGQEFVTLQQDTVYHLGCKWGCLVDKTQEEPKWNSAAWSMLEGDPNYYLTISSPKGQLFRRSQVDADLKATVAYGNIDITDEVTALAGTEVEWLRDTGNTADDNTWTPQYVDGKKNVIHVDNSNAHGVGSGFGEAYREVTFTCRVYVPVGGGTKKMVEGKIQVR